MISWAAGSPEAKGNQPLTGSDNRPIQLKLTITTNGFLMDNPVIPRTTSLEGQRLRYNNSFSPGVMKLEITTTRFWRRVDTETVTVARGEVGGAMQRSGVEGVGVVFVDPSAKLRCPPCPRPTPLSPSVTPFTTRPKFTPAPGTGTWHQLPLTPWSHAPALHTVQPLHALLHNSTTHPSHLALQEPSSNEISSLCRLLASLLNQLQ